ncbi:MAG TPA: DUF2723 domain-containing protein [Bacteroidia bacterium]|jgi:hypothetical protein|nr:DUF2723 domain-containing protein [Bacteroidia bacterium]
MAAYKKLNIIIGWIVFGIAAFTYLSTIEPTASFWDCGEYIATSYKLEVGHPPGAPLFNMIARFFTLFGDKYHAAMLVNSMSALCSAATILFLFWSITMLAKKLYPKNKELSTGEIWAIMGAGAVGALAYTFTDSFWFSAVEGEVYAMSSMFTAAVFWCMLRWEQVADEPRADRWLILAFYLIGLSIGVHLLSLLTIPSMVFIYYFKRFKVTRKSFIITTIVSVFLLGFVQSFLIPWIVKLAGTFELFFVNVVHLPFNSGTIAYFALLVGGIVWGIRYTKAKNFAFANTAIISFACLVLGYSSFMVLIIRANANTPMNQNRPTDAIGLLSYLNRDQYGDWPLLYGPYYTAKLDQAHPYLDGSPLYAKDEKAGKYVIVDQRDKTKPNYDERYCTIFPRMYDGSEPSKVAAYKRWGHIKDRKYLIDRGGGQYDSIEKPTFGDNMTYFWNYQIWHMYARYFMWNFVGKQNDAEGFGNKVDGNWLSGIGPIDDMRLGDQNRVPKVMKENKARNEMYFLPLILGLLGLWYHYKKSKEDMWVILLLFFFTGLAIILFLNQKPIEPRERDYAYVGSFYAFAIWIGLGVLAIFDFLRKKTDDKKGAVIATVVCLLAVPCIMAKAEWNDHDRSNRRTALALAKNYLNSCAPNAILFTHGDNDTFPLWYAQEVEGVRTDVRVIVLSYFNIDWYIDQMKHKEYESEPVPIKIPSEKYRGGTRDYLPIVDKGMKGYFPINEVVNFMTNDDDASKLEMGNGKMMNYVPTRKISIPVNKEAVLRNGTVPANMADRIEPVILWDLTGNYITKSSLMIMDIIANNNWERPIYFGSTGGSEAYLNLNPYFQQEGYAYRLVPIKNKQQEMAIAPARVNTTIMYNNVMNKFDWGNMDRHDVYIDNYIANQVGANERMAIASLSQALINENKKDSAIAVLDKGMKMVPAWNVPLDDRITFTLCVEYYQAGAIDKGNALAKQLFDLYEDRLRYFRTFHGDDVDDMLRSEIQISERILKGLVEMSAEYKQDALRQNFEPRFRNLGIE